MIQSVYIKIGVVKQENKNVNGINFDVSEKNCEEMITIMMKKYLQCLSDDDFSHANALILFLPSCLFPTIAFARSSTF